MKPLDIQATMDAVWFIAAFPFVLLGSFYVLWVLYLAVMNLKRVKDAGQLSRMALGLGYPVLFLGWILDWLINVTIATLWFQELPQSRMELVTHRLSRYIAGPPGTKQHQAKIICEHLLDLFDPTGKHCKN